MTKGLEAVLDECLNRIAADKDQGLDACVAASASHVGLNEAQRPALARELEPLLHLASDLAALREDTPPPPSGLQAGRQKLLREAARLKELEHEKAQSRRLPLFPFGLQSLLRRSAAVVALAAILVVTVLGGGTIAASANSLPGDGLYAVKRMAEELQLAFTLDRQARVELVQKLDERRREEARAVATTHRVAEMSFRGNVNQMDASSWTVGGVVVLTSAETALEGDIGVGTLVRVDVRSMSDGTLWAVRIVAQPPEVVSQPTLAPTPAPTETEVPTPVPPTAVPPTAVPTQAEAHPTTAPLEVPPSLTPSPMPTSTPVPTRTRTRTPTVTPVPPTPLPPREIKIRFSGTIGAISAQSWIVDGQTVRINTNTRIDESQARAAVGATATVLALRQEDDSLLALEIQIEPPPPTPEQPFEFQGLIESWSATRWVVGGYTVTVNNNTAIQGSPQKGLLATVKALRQSDGSLLARSITVQLPTEEVQFEGQIQSIGASQWVIEGVTVYIDAQTQIVGAPSVGVTVEVQGLLLPDGAVIGRRIVVQSVAAPATSARTSSAPVASPPTSQPG